MSKELNKALEEIAKHPYDTVEYWKAIVDRNTIVYKERRNELARKLREADTSHHNDINELFELVEGWGDDVEPVLLKERLMEMLESLLNG